MNPVLAVRLHPVHGLVGGVQQVGDRLPSAVARGEADRRRQADVEAFAGEKAELRDAGADALRDALRAGLVGFGQDQRELVTAVSRQDVGFAGARAKDTCKLDQRAAAPQVAVACR